jgi:hypothetical protein
MYAVYQRNQARKKKSRGVWWIRWDFRGASRKESLFTADRDEAQERAAQRWAEITAGKGNRQGAEHYTFKGAVADYGGEDRFVDVLKVALDETPLGAIDSALLARVGKQLYPGVHTRTIHRNVFTPFTAVFNRAAADGKVPWRKFPKPKLTREEREAEAGSDAVKYVSDDYLLTWLSHASVSPKLKAAALFGTYTAARATIAVELEWRQVNMAERAVYMGKEKNGQPRRVVMQPDLFQALADLPVGKPEERVFGYRDRFTLADNVRATQEAAGLETHGFHQIGRHTFAARYLAQGHNLRQLMEAGGWRSYKAVLIYAHLERKTVDQTIRDLPGLKPASPVLRLVREQKG